MPKKPKDQEAQKRSPVKKPGTRTPKAGSGGTKKTEGQTGTQKTSPAPSAGNIGSSGKCMRAVAK